MLVRVDHSRSHGTKLPPSWTSDRGYANFYEKALFVKADVAAALWLTQLLSLCPSRYASIRTVSEFTLR